MFNPKSLEGKRFALVMWAKDARGQDDVAVFCGTAYWKVNKLIVKFNNNSTFEIFSKWFSKIKKADGDIRDILFGADYLLTLSVGKISENAKSSDFKKTRLKWPKRTRRK